MFKIVQPTIKQLLEQKLNKVNSTGEIKRVTVNGWIETFRAQKSTSFLQINDGSCKDGLQAVIDSQKFAAISSRLTTGTCVALTGILNHTKERIQQIELAVDEINMYGTADPATYPLHKGRLPMDHLRQYPHLRSRSKTFSCIWRIRHGLTRSIDDFFSEHQFLQINAPIITGNDCEGAGEAFKVVSSHDSSTRSFFKKPVFATVSAQLHLEFLASSLSRVYSLGPCFRAEPSDGTRHLAEFWMLEAEMAFLHDLSQLLDLIEGQIKHSVNYILKHNNSDVDFIDAFVQKGIKRQLESYATVPFKRITYQEAIQILSAAKKKWEFPLKDGLPLQSEHEKYLAEQVFNSPVFVTHYPSSLKPFYMKKSKDGNHALCTDLIFPKWGEVVGGSLREDSYDTLKDSILQSNLNMADYNWYLDLRRWGSCPHGGYGLGFERLLGVITGIGNIRDLIPVPNYLSHCPL